MNDNYDNPDAIDPCAGKRNPPDEIQEVLDNDIELIGLKKVCIHCSKPEKQVFMDELVGTMAELYDDPEEDNEYVRTWAQCTVCKRVICVK